MRSFLKKHAVVVLVAGATALVTAGAPALAGGSSGSSGSQPGGVVASSSFVQGNGALLSAVKTSVPGAGFKTLFTLPGLLRVRARCSSLGSFSIGLDQAQVSISFEEFQNFGSGTTSTGGGFSPGGGLTFSNSKSTDEITMHIRGGFGSTTKAATVFIWSDSGFNPCVFTAQALVQT